MSSEEDACDICDGDKSSKKNPIVFCDGEDCNLPVHKMCYKVDEVPEDDWFCQRCDNKSKNKPVKMVCCPIETGAARHTVTFGDFMHVVCAMWNKEINSEIEPYSFNKKLLNQKKCSLCDNSRGLCIKCEEPDCLTVFHVTCAINNGLIIPAITVPPHYSPRCTQHQPTTPSKNNKPTRRRLLSGSLIDSSSDELDSENSDEDVVMKDVKREDSADSEIVPSKRGSKVSSDEEDDMGTSKRAKPSISTSSGSSYRELLEAKRKKSSLDAKSTTFSIDPKRPTVVNPHLSNALSLGQRSFYNRPASVSPVSPVDKDKPRTEKAILTRSEKTEKPIIERPALGRPEKPIPIERANLGRPERPTLGRPEKQTRPATEKALVRAVDTRPLVDRPRWGVQASSQPTTPSISSKSFFDVENVQRKGSEGWIGNGEGELVKMREDLRRMTLEKENTARTLNKMTDEFNRLRDEKKKWINFKKAVTEVFSGLNFQSPGDLQPTTDTIEQYITHIQSMIKRCGPITDEESARIEEACKSINPK